MDDLLRKKYNGYSKKHILSPRKEGIQMDGKFKFLLLVALILYVVSPVDLVPGPIDDIILCLAYVITRRRISARKAPDVIDASDY